MSVGAFPNHPIRTSAGLTPSCAGPNSPDGDVGAVRLAVYSGGQRQVGDRDADVLVDRGVAAHDPVLRVLEVDPAVNGGIPREGLARRHGQLLEAFEEAGVGKGGFLDVVRAAAAPVVERQ